MKVINKFIIALFIFSLFNGGCSHEAKWQKSSKESLNRIIKLSIKNPNNDSLIFLSSYIREVKIIPLEFNKSCILGDINKIVIADNSIFIQDKQNNEGIFRFDMNGKFICKIGRLGKGPSEHLNLTDFSINPNSGNIYIYSNSQRKVLEYSIGNKFIKERLLNYAAECFEYKNNHFYLYRENPQLDENYNLIIKDMDGKTVSRYFKSEPDKRSSSSKVFSPLRDRILLYRNLYDTIYSINGDSLEYAYHIDYGKHSVKPEDRSALKNWSSNILEIMNSNNYISGIDNLLHVNNIIFFTYIYHNIENKVFYNDRTKKITSSYSVMDDLSWFSFFAPIAQTEECFVSTYNPSSIKNNIKNIKFHAGKLIPSEGAKTAIDKLSSLNQSDPSKINPFIILYYIKKQK